MEGDLFGVTSTGEAEKPTSGAGSGTPETNRQTLKNVCRHLNIIQHEYSISRIILHLKVINIIKFHKDPQGPKGIFYVPF